MVGHQTECEHLERSQLHQPTSRHHDFKKGAVVIVVDKRDRPSNAPRHDVVTGTLEFDPRRPAHMPRLFEEAVPAKRN